MFYEYYRIISTGAIVQISKPVELCFFFQCVKCFISCSVPYLGHHFVFLEQRIVGHHSLHKVYRIEDETGDISH